jgi:hypothetical protein
MNCCSRPNETTMASFQKVDQSIIDTVHGVHDFDNHAFAVALTTLAHKPDKATTKVLADLTQIDYSNLVGSGTGTGGRTLVRASYTPIAGVVKLVLADWTITSTANGTASFGAVVLYNATVTSHPILGWWEFTMDIVPMNNGEFATLICGAPAGVIGFQ